MIPCIAIPVLNRLDLLQRCLNSIDFPVGVLWIVNNGLGSTTFSKPPSVEVMSGIQPSSNLGVAGSWNNAMDAALNALNLGAVMIIGSDIQWQPGQLQTFFETWQANPDASFLYAHWAYSTFMVTRRGFETIGWFDENFYPGYLEDSDHWWRIGRYKKLGVDVQTVDVPVTPVHGEAPHWGSSTLKSDPDIARQVAAGHKKNWAYFMAKWGGQMAGGTERFDHPFDNPTIPVNSWKLSADRLRQPHYRVTS